MKKENLKKLLKNMCIGALLGCMISIVYLFISITLPYSGYNYDMFRIAMDTNFDNPTEVDSMLMKSTNEWLNKPISDNEILEEEVSPYFTQNNLILTYAHGVFEGILSNTIYIIVSGILGGVVYYNIWGKNSEIKTSIRKIITNYILIGLFILTVITLCGIILDGRTISGLIDLYKPTFIFYTLAYILIFVINYLNNKRLTKKLNNNL